MLSLTKLLGCCVVLEGWVGSPGSQLLATIIFLLIEQKFHVGGGGGGGGGGGYWLAMAEPLIQL